MELEGLKRFYRKKEVKAGTPKKNKKINEISEEEKRLFEEFMRRRESESPSSLLEKLMEVKHPSKRVQWSTSSMPFGTTR